MNAATPRLVSADDPCHWTAADFPEPRKWVTPFTEAMLAEMDTAIARVRAAGIDPGRMTAADFPVPSGERLFRAARETLDLGRGFYVFAGFPVERYDEAACRIAYCGVAANLGVLVDQATDGTRVVDVKDMGTDYDRRTRGYHARVALKFHTDGSDVAGLMCLQRSEEGGESLIANGAAIYNAFCRERPDLLDICYRGFHHQRRGNAVGGMLPYTEGRLPIFGFEDGLFYLCWDRLPMEWAQEEKGEPITAREREAFDFLDSLAARPENHISMAFEPGDMQFVNNHTVLHSRTEFRDSPTRRRHLLRVWFNMPDARRNGPTKILAVAPHESRYPMPAA